MLKFLPLVTFQNRHFFKILFAYFKVGFSIDRLLNNSDLDGMTPDNTYNFDLTQANLNDAKALHVVSASGGEDN